MSENNIPDGAYAVIELEQCVSSAKLFLRIETSDHDIWLKKLANDAAKRIDAGDQYVVKDKILDVVSNDYTDLPCEFDQLISLRYGAGDNCYGMAYVDLPFLKTCGCSIPNASHYGNYMRIQDGQIFYYYGVTPQHATAPVTQVTLSYWATNKDENGLRKIYSVYEDAITYFICYSFALAYSERYKPFVISEFKQNYMAQKDFIIGKWQQRQFRNKKRQIAQTTNAWVSAKTWAH